MKRMLRVALTLVGFIFLSATTVFAGQVVEAEIHGIACSFCAYGLEKKIKKLSGVESVSVDVTRGKAVIAMRGPATLDRASLEKAVKEAGFSLKTFSVRDS